MVPTTDMVYTEYDANVGHNAWVIQPQDVLQQHYFSVRSTRRSLVFRNIEMVEPVSFMAIQILQLKYQISYFISQVFQNDNPSDGNDNRAEDSDEESNDFKAFRSWQKQVASKPAMANQENSRAPTSRQTDNSESLDSDASMDEHSDSEVRRFQYYAGFFF
jgi:hypothetical protein